MGRISMKCVVGTCRKQITEVVVN